VLVVPPADGATTMTRGMGAGLLMTGAMAAREDSGRAGEQHGHDETDDHPHSSHGFSSSSHQGGLGGSSST
jgi:hypothetical protein